ncbi:MAG: DUF805 domain-containing protein [Sphingomonadaceae bacterium]
MIMPFKRYFDYQGRSRRMEYWSFFLLNMIVTVVLYGILFGVGGGMEAMMNSDPTDPTAAFGAMFGGVGILILLWALATFIPNIMLNIRRLHDRDMSGWWLLGLIIGSMIPFIGIIVSIAYLVLMFLPGTPGPNRFGPDPKDPSSAEVFS